MSIYAVPSTTFQAVLTGAPSSTTVNVQVLNASTGNVSVARSSTSIVENPAGSGTYIATRTAPSVTGEYVVVWDTAGSGSLTSANTTSEELYVTGTPPTPTTTATGEQFSMSLSALRSEVLNHGFDGTIYSSSRLNQYLNDALGELSAKAQYYGEEQELTMTTTAGTDWVAFPTGMSRLRSVRLTDPPQDLQLVDLRDVDRTGGTTGSPYAYAVDGSGITLFPKPDGAYALAIRYWRLMSPLTADTDVPSLPARYHRMLAYYAIARCFEGEDDPQQAAYYDAKWTQAVKDLKLDLVFPLTDGPRQVKSIWDSGAIKQGWGLW